MFISLSEAGLSTVTFFWLILFGILFGILAAGAVWMYFNRRR